MNNPTHDAQTVREMQQLAVAALDELLSHDLPTLSWDLSKHIDRPAVNGLVRNALSDDDQRANVREWADFLKTEVTERRNREDTYTLVQAIGEFENVTVTVWAHVDYARGSDE